MSYVAAAGEFNRDTNYISSRITADGRDGYPVEPGRYRLIVARACPWANRTIIVRRLLGLEKVLSIGFCGPTHDTRSWTFDLDPGGLDPVLKIHFLRDAYNKRIPDYPKGVTVPAIVDAPTGAVVTNDFAQMTVDFSTQWTHFHREGAPSSIPSDGATRSTTSLSASTPRSTTASTNAGSRAHRMHTTEPTTDYSAHSIGFLSAYRPNAIS